MLLMNGEDFKRIVVTELNNTQGCAATACYSKLPSGYRYTVDRFWIGGIVMATAADAINALSALMAAHQKPHPLVRGFAAGPLAGDYDGCISFRRLAPLGLCVSWGCCRCCCTATAA